MSKPLIAIIVAGILYGAAIFYIIWTMFFSKEARRLRQQSKKLQKANQLIEEERYYEALVEFEVLKPKEK